MATASPFCQLKRRSSVSWMFSSTIRFDVNVFCRVVAEALLAVQGQPDARELSSVSGSLIDFFLAV